MDPLTKILRTFLTAGELRLVFGISPCGIRLICSLVARSSPREHYFPGCRGRAGAKHTVHNDDASDDYTQQTAA